MKFINLNLQAFGPFAGTESIDFNELGDNPLFLIDGPTGAGKSSILHAICFALYGETTDEERKDVGLRCDNAKAETLTQVCLRFAIGEQQYQITRMPTQRRKAKRGDGETEQKTEAHLVKILSDGTEQTLVAKKKKDADDEIKRIIGLTAEQFRQVMVLPQGKFRQLLLANSSERQQILSTLFQTEIYQRIEQNLKQQANEIEREYAKFNDQILESLKEAYVDDKEQLNAEHESAIEQTKLCEQQKLKLDQQRQTALQAFKSAQQLLDTFSLYNNKKKQSSELEQQLPIINGLVNSIKRAKQADGLRPDHLALMQCNNDLTDNDNKLNTVIKQQQVLTVDIERAQNELQKAIKEHGKRDDLLKLKSNYAGYVDGLAKLEQLYTEKQTCQQKLLQAQTYKKAAEEKIAENQQRSEVGLQKIEHLQQQLEGLADLQLRQQQLQQQNGLFVQRDQLLLKITNSQPMIIKKQQQLSDASEQYTQAVEHANRLEMHWHTNQAAMLAQSLKIGESCPVCGATEHPEPATLEQQHAVSKESVEQARHQQQQLQNSKNNVDKELSSLTLQVQQWQQQVTELEQQLGGAVNSDRQQMAQDLIALDKQITELQKGKLNLPKWRELRDKLQNELLPLTQLVTKHDEEASRFQQQFVAATTTFENAESAIPENFRNLDVLQKAQFDNEQRIELIEFNYNKATKQVQQLSNQDSALQGSKKQLQDNKSQLLQRQEQLTEIWQQAINKSDFSNEQEFKQALLEQQQLNELQQKVDTFNELQQSLAGEIKLLTQQLEGKQEPNIERLTQARAKAENDFVDSEKLWQGAQQKQIKLNDIIEKIARIESEQQQNKEQFEQIGTLARAAGGKGKVRVSLERFVLGDLLDSVLMIASKRLQIMSKGQYCLVRQDEGLQKRNVTAGLDLAIDDAYTGKTRPVSTLSGGESFLASLALALALSDVVQQRSGGILLDTLFIDEGFGSLDQESLQLAIQTLVDLQQTGRTIGIISHVSELKEQMALRVDVKSSKTGSSISTFTN
ncbi:AAA family ATPase [Thalassotalea crassostreae]|uniref:AAA family ATPase n=1 Tax=Thalassotalea crassostreae TaxID=1763536 RepID=UPI0008396D38|nr:SMC family ATPase [Thalassotalea crassostreae]